MMINMRFVEFVKHKLGAAKFNAIRKKKPRNWESARKSFEENVKRAFDPDGPKTFEILFGLDNGETPHVVDGFLTVTAAEVKAMFQPVVDEVIQLVDGQIAHLRMRGESVNGIVLVGGFGQSIYLYNCLKARVADMSPVPKVLQPINAWTAVVRGAVLRGLEGSELVLSRRARRHYGIRCTSRFNPLLHSQSRKEWDHLEEDWIVNDQILWYIRKDQVCSTKDPICFCEY